MLYKDFKGGATVFVEFRAEENFQVGQREGSVLEGDFSKHGNGQAEKYVAFGVLAFSGFEVTRIKGFAVILIIFIHFILVIGCIIQNLFFPGFFF